jgi:spore germination cell wall hydrolase CwlJ-like protein
MHSIGKTALSLSVAILSALWCVVGHSRGVESPINGPDQVAVETILLEAANQPMDGQIAVGNVIRNRARTSGTYFEAVCLKRYQFSCWLDRAWAERRLARATPLEWANARLAWERSESSNLVGDSRHYYAPKYASPKWARGATKVYQIGAHRFVEGVR